MSFDEEMMGRAWVASENATCDRLHVGCVLSYAGQVIAVGWNTSLHGLSTCDEVGHDLVNNSCARVQHAEMMAIANASRAGRSLLGTELFVTASCCWPCFRMAAACGIGRIVYGTKFYRDVDRITDAAKTLGIQLEHLEVT